MNKGTTMVTYTFTPAQQALLAHYMAPDVLPLDEAAQTTLGLNAQELEEVEEDLRERHWLVRPVGEDVAVAGELAALLATTMFPDQVAILRTILPDRAQPPVYFSFAGEDTAYNFVDENGQYVFSAFDSLDQALDALIAKSGIPAHLPPSANGRPYPLAMLMADCQTLAMLMIVDEPTQPHSTARTLSWLLARGALWLVDPSAPEESPAALSANHDMLREAITSTLTPPAVSRP